MRPLAWNEEKNKRLKQERGISFEDIEAAIDAGGLLDDIDHPNQERYPHQRMFIVFLKNYVYAVPYVEDKTRRFLKTIFPSSRYAKKYSRGKNKQGL